MKASDLIRTCFAAYETKDRALIESLLSDDFTFSSPLDDNIDRDTYFERCWPNSEHIRSFRLERIFEEGPEAFVTYEGERMDGTKFRNTEFFIIRQGHIHHVDVFFGSESPPAVHETEVRALMQRHAKACRNKDVPAMVATYAPDVEAFDTIAPLHYQGYEKMGMRLLEWLSFFEGPIQYEVHDLVVHTVGDIAYTHSLHRVMGRKISGEDADQWWRCTHGCRKIHGHWLITHEHTSIPFDPVTEQVAQGLKP